MVEFALCAPVVFGLLFGIVGGSLFMYSRNVVARAENVAVITEAAEGVSKDVDLDSLAAIRATGLGPQSLTRVDSILIEGFKVDGTPMTGCKDATGTLATLSDGSSCYDRYAVDGSPMWQTTTATCSDTVYHCPPFPPSARSVKASSVTSIKLTIAYHFTLVGVAGPAVNFSSVQFFRLEPKDL